MIKLLIDFIQFLNSTAPLLTSLAIFTLLSVLLSKSIKKHAVVYYIVFAIPFALFAIPFVGRLFGFEMFSFSRIPFLGGIIRDYIHFGTFAFPVLIIIMYIGALDMKIPWVKKLMNIRKELSIISGFPVLTHSLIRVTNNFPNSLKFFTNHEAYMETARVTNVWGAGISNFSFVLGIVLLALFIPLWVTSFDSVHKRMGSVKWKKLQKWSYLFYALLFIHAMGIQVGGMINPRGGGAPKPAVEVTTAKPDAPESNSETARSHADTERSEGRNGRNAAQAADESGSQGEVARSGGKGRAQSKEFSDEVTAAKADTPDSHNESTRAHANAERDDNAVQAAKKSGDQGEVAQSTGKGRAQSIGFSDIKVSSQAKRYIHIISLLLIFGSYLYLRLRKASKDADKKKSKSMNANA